MGQSKRDAAIETGSEIEKVRGIRTDGKAGLVIYGGPKSLRRDLSNFGCNSFYQILFWDHHGSYRHFHKCILVNPAQFPLMPSWLRPCSLLEP